MRLLSVGGVTKPFQITIKHVKIEKPQWLTWVPGVGQQMNLGARARGGRRGDGCRAANARARASAAPRRAAGGQSGRRNPGVMDGNALFLA